MTQIPNWVYFLFLALLYMGYKNCFKRVIKTKMLILIPALFIWLSVKDLFKTSEIVPTHVVYYITGGLIGIYLGYLHARKTQVRADKHQQLIELPGDWTVLILVMVIFAVQFVIGYLLAIDPQINESAKSMAAIYIISGITTGIVAGRNLTYFYKFNNAHHVHLENPKSLKK